MSDPYICSLIVETQSQEENILLRQAYRPFLSWIDPSFKLIKLMTQSYKNSNKRTHHSFDQLVYSPDIMTSPALSVMFFLHDTGPLSSESFQQHFVSEPWKLHHRVELVNINSPNLALAEQKFFQAGHDTPLWVVCPVEQGNEHLRFNIFVRDFPAMVEFYRVVTGVEMETTKDNFCWFQLYSQPGVKIRLGLKYHKSINPVPSQKSCLRFKVNNINNLRDVIGTKVQQTAPGCFVVVDPDGNKIHLETGHANLSILTTSYSLLQPTKKVSKELNVEHCKTNFNTKILESSDSGRFSDSEAGASDYKSLHENIKSDDKIFTASSDNEITGANLPIQDSNFQKLKQPNLTFKEKLVQVLRKGKTLITENFIESSKIQFQTVSQKGCVKIRHIKSNEERTIPRQGQFSRTQRTHRKLNTETLENAQSLGESKNNNRIFPPNESAFSPLLPLKTAEDETDDGFFDQSSPESCKLVFCDDLKGMYTDSIFSGYNIIKINNGNNLSETVRLAKTIENNIIDESTEIFV